MTDPLLRVKKGVSVEPRDGLPEPVSEGETVTGRYLTALARVHVLASYGINLEGPKDFEEWLAWTLDTDHMEAWFGERFPPYIKDELAALRPSASDVVPVPPVVTETIDRLRERAEKAERVARAAKESERARQHNTLRIDLISIINAWVDPEATDFEKGSR